MVDSNVLHLHRVGATPLSRRGLDVALTATSLGLIALYVALFAVRNVALQWDFHSYVLAARAALAGLDPYRVEHLQALGGKVALPFVYPPSVLLAFLPMTMLAPPAAAAAWMGLKIAILVGLVIAWRLRFAPQSGVMAIALLAVFGWNGSALWDLGSGNVALIEAALLWSAFGCYMSGRRAAFVALVVAASCFKVLPAAFLLLALAPAAGRPASRKPFILGAIAVALVIFGPMIVGPASGWQPFWASVPVADTLGAANPGALGFLATLIADLGVSGGASRAVAGVAWMAYALALVAASRPVLARAWRNADARTLVMAAVMLYVLLSPRPMAYGFVLLAPAPLFFAPRPFDRPWGRLALAAFLSVQGLGRAAHHESGAVVYVYAPFVLTLCVWLLVVSSHAAATDRASRAKRPPARLAA